jgi:hypothetical protein
MQLTIIQVEREEFLHSRILERSDRIKSHWLQISNDLKEIKKDKLYLRKAKSFEEYCSTYFGFGKSVAYQLISGGEVIENLNVRNCGHLPQTESQARPLTKLEPELQRETWSEVLEENEILNITAKIIAEKTNEKKELNEVVKEVKRENQPNTIFVQTPLTEKEILKRAKEITKKKKPAHVAYNSGENEWYTAAIYVETARKVMGCIDLDPASSDIANKTVKASKYYTKGDNGLNKKWSGNIWLNPPYAQPLINEFSQKIINELQNIESIIILVNNATETKWFQRIMKVCNCICFVKSRIRFLDPLGNLGAPLQGQSVIYIGEDENSFTSNFSKYGICLSRKE